MPAVGGAEPMRREERRQQRSAAAQRSGGEGRGWKGRWACVSRSVWSYDPRPHTSPHQKGSFERARSARRAADSSTRPVWTHILRVGQSGPLILRVGQSGPSYSESASQDPHTPSRPVRTHTLRVGPDTLRAELRPLSPFPFPPSRTANLATLRPPQARPQSPFRLCRPPHPSTRIPSNARPPGRAGGRHRAGPTRRESARWPRHGCHAAARHSGETDPGARSAAPPTLARPTPTPPLRRPSHPGPPVAPSALIHAPPLLR